MSGWIWWAIGFFGLSGALTVGAVLVFGWPAIIGTKVGRIALTVGTAGLGLVALYFKGRSEGKAAERKRQEDEDAAYLANKAKTDAGIDAEPDDELRRRLHDQRLDKPGG